MKGITKLSGKGEKNYIYSNCIPGPTHVPLPPGSALSTPYSQKYPAKQAPDDVDIPRESQ